MWTRARARAREAGARAAAAALRGGGVRHLEVIVAQAAEGAVHGDEADGAEGEDEEEDPEEADRQADVLVEHVPLVLRLLRCVAEADAAPPRAHREISGGGLGRFGPRFGSGDTVGCGLHLPTGKIFFCHNGTFLGPAFVVSARRPSSVAEHAGSGGESGGGGGESGGESGGASHVGVPRGEGYERGAIELFATVGIDTHHR